MGIKLIIGDCRRMIEVMDEIIRVVVTSSAYWNIKDYDIKGLIGYDQTLYDYLKDFYWVWKDAA